MREVRGTATEREPDSTLNGGDSLYLVMLSV